MIHLPSKDEVSQLYGDAPAYITHALQFLGLQENKGGELNRLIFSWFLNHTYFPLEKITLETPWCAAFVSAVLDNSGYRSAHSAAAIAYLHWGIASETRKYSVVVLDRGHFKRHVGFCVGEREGVIDVLGGNQQNCVCIQAYPLEKALEFRVPSPN